MPAFVQGVPGSNTFGGTSATQAFTSNVTAGNLLIAIAQWYLNSGSTSITTVTDTLGSSGGYTLLTKRERLTTTTYGQIATQVAYATAASSGPCTVTANWAASVSGGFLTIIETTPGLFDQETFDVGSGTAVNAGTLTAPANSFGVTSTVIDDGIGRATGWLANTGWTLLQDTGGGGAREAVEYIAGSGSLVGSLTATDTGLWVASITTFKSSSAALTGTASGGMTEADVVGGGKTIITTLTGDTFIAN